MNSLQEEKSIRVSVWDTFVRKQNGNVLHFDIIVPEHISDPDKIFNYGNEYLATKGENNIIIDSKQCQFCHIEAITEEIRQAISSEGYFIHEMEDIPQILPMNPSRKDLVLHIKGHFKELRFTNFAGIPNEELNQIIYSKEFRYNFSRK